MEAICCLPVKSLHERLFKVELKSSLRKTNDAIVVGLTVLTYVCHIYYETSLLSEQKVDETVLCQRTSCLKKTSVDTKTVSSAHIMHGGSWLQILGTNVFIIYVIVFFLFILSFSFLNFTVLSIFCNNIGVALCCSHVLYSCLSCLTMCCVYVLWLCVVSMCRFVFHCWHISLFLQWLRF